MAATGAFAVDEGLVETEPGADIAVVNVWSVNISKNIKIQVPLSNGMAKVKGDYNMPGVSDPGAKFIVDIENPGGGKTGQDLPIGNKSYMDALEMEYTFCDIVNPLAYLRAGDLGIEATEPNEEIMQHERLMQTLEDVRANASAESGLAPNLDIAKHEYVALPKVAYE